MRSQKDRKRSACLIAALAGVLLIYPVYLFSAVMQSNGYRIQSDSINIGGGLATSSSYIGQDTLGEVGTGFGTSSSYTLSAGYQAMQSTYISITDSADITLPPLGGVSGGNSTGQSTWTVVTDDPAGYQLTMVATSSPALKAASSSIPDYVPAGAAPDFTFTYASNASVFGFSPEGVDIVSRYKDNGVACNTGSSDTLDRCWDGASTTAKLISQKTSANQPSGSTTTIKYQVGIGSSKLQASGVYKASIIVTAISL